MLLWLLLAPYILPQSTGITNVQDTRVQFQQLWAEILTRTPNKTTCLPLSQGDIKRVARGIIALNATHGEIDSLVFYKTHPTDKAVGMRVSIAFPRRINHRGTIAHILSIVDVRPTGRWHLFNFCNCDAKKVSKFKHDVILQA